MTRRLKPAPRPASLPVFFGDPVAPVECAVEIARATREQSSLKLRMGVHSGPVHRVEDINEQTNVSGAAINLAQRVMDCGDAGHILLSSAAAENLRQVGGWSEMLHDLGTVEVKHGERVHVFNLASSDVGVTPSP